MVETCLEAKARLGKAINELGRSILAELDKALGRPAINGLSRLISRGKAEW